MASCSLLVLLLTAAIGYLLVTRRRHLGHQHSGRVGICDRQFRLVDRHRPRRDVYLGAFLLLLRQDWRTTINRFAEAMTLFAVACAGMFPLLHLGRPWLFYWLLPYPNTMRLWPQFRSPLVWDVFAVSTYCDGLAAVLVRRSDPGPGDAARSRASNPVSANGLRHPRAGLARLRHALAALSDRLISCSPGWRPRWSSRCTASSAWTSPADSSGLALHDLPALLRRRRDLRGFAMVLTLAIPLRAVYGLKDFITMQHLDNWPS